MPGGASNVVRALAPLAGRSISTERQSIRQCQSSMPAIGTAEPLSPEQAQRLAEFARACKAAARVVSLYPATHPAIKASLQRVGDAAERLRSTGNATMTVLPDGVLLEGRTTPRPDPAIGELAHLLHLHLVGELSLQGELTPHAWHAFLSLLARTPEDVIAEGGIGRAWLAAGGGPLEIRQIDYAEVMRDRTSGLAAEWDSVIANYLEGELSDLDDATLEALFDIARDTNRFRDFAERLVAQASEGGRRGKKEMVLRMLQALADYVARTNPEQLDRIFRQIAGILPQLTPEMVVTLITTGVPLPEGARHEGVDLAGEVRARISEESVAQFVARAVSRDRGATARLAQAFQTLVPDADRHRLLEMAHEELEHLPIGRQPDFPDLWKSAENLLTSYTDSAYVPEDYAHELSAIRTQAIELERVTDDPPERIGSWLKTVADPEVRKLDQQLVLDLLQIETRPDAWRKVLDTAIELTTQLVLVGNIPLAQQTLDRMMAAAAKDQPFADVARAGLERLRGGAIIKHVILFIRRAEETDLPAISSFCRTLGPSVMGPLVEALAADQSAATIRRLREVLLTFGAAGRIYADELRTSANPAVRRTAIELLRAFGGADALPDLTPLLDDAEPGVQREAVRAIVHIGTNEAYAVLQNVLQSGTARTRDAIMQQLASTRDERAAPLFIYILDNADFGARLESVYLAAIEALGKAAGDQASIEALRKVLYRGDWWAPLRTKRFRTAAARALGASGGELARQTLEEAAHNAPRGARRIARSALAEAAPDSQTRSAS
jgi:hypothetical protein